ncbi:hypothetical protein BH11MYX4_BH11MYX4_51500 [soil metagenome]
MSDEDPPDDRPSDPPSAPPKESRRSRLESVIPEIIKRAVELGVEKARESPDTVRQFVHDLKVPKEVAHVIFQQIDDTKNGLFRVVAKEIRDFLEHTNFAGEVQKLLTTVQFEVNTTIRFTPNDGREPRKDGDGSEGEAKAEGDAPSDKDKAHGDEESTSTRLPKHEVKTSVHVRRDDRDRTRRNRRSTRGGA